MLFDRSCISKRCDATSKPIKKIGLRRAGRNVFVGKSVESKCKNKMDFGTGVTIQDQVVLDALSRNGIHLGNGSSI